MSILKKMIGTSISLKHSDYLLFPSISICYLDALGRDFGQDKYQPILNQTLVRLYAFRPNKTMHWVKPVDMVDNRDTIC